MILNCNFEHNLESIINSYEPLADWFERNQNSMVYYELTKPNCLHLEDMATRYDTIVLGRMANAALSSLSIDTQESKEKRAYAAALAINDVYAREENQLSESAKIKYRIEIVELEEHKDVNIRKR